MNNIFILNNKKIITKLFQNKMDPMSRTINKKVLKTK